MIITKYQKYRINVKKCLSLISIILILFTFEGIKGKTFAPFEHARFDRTDPKLSLEKKPGPEKLKQDFAIFRKALEEGHPGLYRYSNKAYMDRRFNTIETTIASQKDITLADFYRLLAVSIAMIKDTHTNIYLSPETTQYHLKNDRFFPFKLKYISDQPYITMAFGNNVPVGSRLISINNKSIKEINEILLASVSSDGDNLTRKYKKIEDNFDWRYYLFIEKSDSFEIKYVDSKTKNIQKKRVSALTADEAREFLSSDKKILSQSRQTEKKPLELEFNEQLATAILTIKTFDSDTIKKANQDYAKFLEAAFIKMKEKNIGNLIIDLRNNGGGKDEFGALLFSYLADKNFNYYDYLETSTDHYSFLKYSSKDESFNKVIKNLLVPFAPGRYRLKKNVSPLLSTQKPQKNNFDKKVWVLINGRTSSTAAEFCSIVYSHKRALFVGEEVGGGYLGNTSGTTMSITLPNSKIRVFIPLIKYVLAVSNYSHPRRGVIPDHQIQPDINDVLNGVDVEIPYVLELIKKQRDK